MGSVGMKEHHWGNSLIREWCSCIKSKQQEHRGSLITFALTLMAFFMWIRQYKLQRFSVHAAVFVSWWATQTYVTRNVLLTLLNPALQMTSHRYCFPGRPSHTILISCWEQPYNSCQVSFSAHLIDPLHWQQSKPSGTVAASLHPRCSKMALSSTGWQVGFMQPVCLNGENKLSVILA